MEELHDNYGPEARYAVERRGRAADHQMGGGGRPRASSCGLPGADSIVDRRIPTFSRGELPHFAGINTFLKAPYVEDVRRCGEYDVAVLGAPFDGGTTYRSGTRFGPQGIRKISALYGPYSFELGVDLRESITIADLGDIFTIPGNIEKTFDQITKAVAHVYAVRRLPGRARAATTRSATRPSAASPSTWRRQPRHHPLRPPRRHPGDRPRRADAHHAVVPRHRHPQRAGRRTWCRSASAAGRRRGRACKVGRERGTTIMTVTDCVEMGIEAAAERALDVAWDGADAVWLSLRRRLPRRRVRPRHRLARARRLPAPRGAQVHPAHRRRARWPASRSWSARRPTTTPRSPR